MAGRSKEETGDITLLGNQNTKYASDYAPEVLETFPNKHPDRDYFVQLSGVYQPLPDYRTAGLCDPLHFLRAAGDHGGEQVVEAVSVQLPESRRFPRGLCEHHHERPDQADGAGVH